MNLPAKKLGLLLIAALTLFSCEEENTIGLPPEDNLGIFFAEIPMKDYVNQVWVDDLPYDNSGFLLVGEYDDPQLGRIRSTAYSDLSTTALRPQFPVSDTVTYSFISAEIRLRIDAGYGTVEGNPQVGYALYQLGDTVDIDGEYTNSSSLPLGDKIGETTFTFYSDSVTLNLADSSSNTTINDLADSLFDTNGRYLYVTNFETDQLFWEDVFNRYTDILLDTIAFPDSTLNSAREFDLITKGLAISPELGSTAIRYTSQDIRSFVSIKYNRIAPSGTTEQEMFVLFNSIKAFNEISPNSSSGWNLGKFSSLSEFYEPTTLDDENAYIQSGANLFLSLDFEPFRNFTDTASNTVFQNAQLFINGDSTLIFEGNNPISQLQFLPSSQDRLDEEELQGVLDANFLGELPVAINYNEADSNLIRVPTYLNQLLLNRTGLDKIIVRGPSVSQLSRLVIPKDSIFLRVYYSKTN